MLLRLIGQTVREMLRPHFAAALALTLAVVWLITCALFTIKAERSSPLWWRLDRDWKNDYLSYSHPADLERMAAIQDAIGNDAFFHFAFHQRIVITTQTHVSLVAASLIILLLTSLLLNRLFLQDELTLYLARPLDIYQLFAGRYLGALSVALLFAAAGKILVLWGAMGPEWRLTLAPVTLGFQSEAAVLLGVTALPFLFAPLVGKLFRGAATFIISATVTILAACLQPSPAFWTGLIPFRFNAADPLSHKVLTVGTDLFLLPVPRLFFASHGLAKCLGEDGFISIFTRATLIHGVLDNRGYWYWSVGSSALLVAAAAWSWKKRSSP